jgi:hypothetical protein
VRKKTVTILVDSREDLLSVTYGGVIFVMGGVIIDDSG